METTEVEKLKGPVVIAVVNQKGGAAKTTTAMGLVAELGERHKTLLVDIDPQRSATDWADRIDGDVFDYTHDTDPSHLAALKHQPYEYVIIDTPGSLEGEQVLQTVVEVADFVLLPSEVAGMGLDPLVRTVRRVVEPAGKQYAVVLTRVDDRTRTTTEQMLNILDKCGLNYLESRIRAYEVHKKVQAEGRLITQTSWRDKGSRPAAADVKRVTEEVLELVGEK